MLKIFRKFIPENIILSYRHMYVNEKPRLKIMNSLDTIKYIDKNKCSIARFGDGEFEHILWPNGKEAFQAHNDILTARLKEVLASEQPNLLLCIPYALNDIRGRKDESLVFWYYWCERMNQRKLITDLIKSYHNIDYIFGDSQITRPYIAYKTSNNARKIFPSIINLWKNKDIIIVEGTQTRLGVGNDLFEGTRSVKRILCPATNAFDRIDEIKNKIVEIYNGELIIMALGPTATVLALDLSKIGIQALDIGHLDIEYEWYRRGAKSHELVPNKFTNEADNGDQVNEYNDKKYLSEIVAYI